MRDGVVHGTQGQCVTEVEVEEEAGGQVRRHIYKQDFEACEGGIAGVAAMALRFSAR